MYNTFEDQHYILIFYTNKHFYTLFNNIGEMCHIFKIKYFTSNI